MSKSKDLYPSDVVFHQPTKRVGWVLDYARTGKVKVCFSNSPNCKPEDVSVKDLVKRKIKPISPKNRDVGKEVEVYFIDSANVVGVITYVDRGSKNIHLFHKDMIGNSRDIIVDKAEFSQIVRLGPQIKFQMTPSKTVGPFII